METKRMELDEYTGNDDEFELIQLGSVSEETRGTQGVLPEGANNSMIS